MKKFKHKVNVDAVDDEYKFMVKEEMTNAEVGQLGIIVFKHKLSKLKNKILRRKHERKAKKESKKEI